MTPLTDKSHPATAWRPVMVDGLGQAGTVGSYLGYQRKS